MSHHIESARPVCRTIELAALLALSCLAQPALAQTQPALILAPDATGVTATYNNGGPIDLSNPFFRSLGTNGRSCSTCHVSTQAMSFTPLYAQALYAFSRGRDPLFASVDGANCSTVSAGDRAGHSLILQHGLIRITLPVPANAQYSISVVSDPYGCALQVDPKTGVLTASVYRRPLPSTNLRFLSTVMFDGRETVAPLNVQASFASNLATDLSQQALDATMGHAQAALAPSAADLQAIVQFELGLYSAQYVDFAAGFLDQAGASGGPFDLSAQNYYPGINDVLGADPYTHAFNPAAIGLYGAWASSRSWLQARADIAAGEQIFNNAALTITTVRGLNDNAAVGSPTSLAGHCSSCHDTPNVADHSMPLPLDIGTSHSADANFESDPNVLAALAQLSGPALPVFLISGCPNPFAAGQSESFYTSDPGKALISGQCSDFNRIKGPILRGLAARAPYFHNGAAANLLEVVNFYNQRFQMNLSEQQKHQLVAFLNTL